MMLLFYRGSVDLTLLCNLRQIGDAEKRAIEGICMVSLPGPAARYVAQQAAFEGCCAVRAANSVRLGNAAAQRSSSWFEARGRYVPHNARVGVQTPRYVMTAGKRDQHQQNNKKGLAPSDYSGSSAETALRFCRVGPMRINEIVDKKVISSALLCTPLGQL
jgi:hypothetical protein